MRPGERYAVPAIVLHWLIAGLIVLQLALAWRMEGPATPQAFALTQLHKSVGITILLLSLVRLAWRLIHPPPPLPATLAPWERTLARITHAAFYGVMIGMPLTGWIMVSASRFDIPTILYGRVGWPHLPFLPHLEPLAREAWREGAEQAHGVIILAALPLIALHVAGALKHQLFSRHEPVLARMAPGARPGRWLEPRLGLILAGLVGAAAFGALIQPPRPGVAAPGAPAEPDESPAPAPVPVIAPAAPEPATQPPVRWTKTAGSSLGFTSSWGGEAFRGRFDRWSADIVFSPDRLDESRVRVSIDLASVDTGEAQRDAGLQAPDFFDVGAHPRAVFEARRFEKTGEGRYLARGVLTLRGVSRPLELPFRLNIEGDRAQVSGVTSLDRNAFGVGQGEWASTDQIPAEVRVQVNLKARRE